MLPAFDKDFSERVASFCIGAQSGYVENENASQFGLGFTKWDGKSGFTRRFGQPSPVSRDTGGKFVTSNSALRFIRACHTFTELESLGHCGPARLDMNDARDYGVSEATGVSAPVLVYNRRADAKNLILWPLAPYHTLGNEKFVHPEPIDTIPFEAKTDIAFWRGNLSGRPNKALAPDVAQRRYAVAIMKSIVTATSEEELWQYHEELMGITRYNFVLRYYKSADMNVALTLRGKNKKARNSQLLAPLCKHRMAMSWFFNSKYLFSLSGNDTGSNFLMAANSNSVVLKEEDGWDLFYTNEFRPWEHYIPLTLGATDAEEKLDWAKQNPKACKEMVSASQAVCAKFASPENRRMYLSEILAFLRKAH